MRLGTWVVACATAAACLGAGRAPALANDACDGRTTLWVSAQDPPADEAGGDGQLRATVRGEAGGAGELAATGDGACGHAHASAGITGLALMLGGIRLRYRLRVFVPQGMH